MEILAHEHFLSDQVEWIVTQGTAVRVDKTKPVAFGRETKSWGWIYQVIHEAVQKQNRKGWGYALPKNYRSELVDNIHFVSYDNTSTVSDLWAMDIGQRGHTAKRAISVVVFLNDDFEGGEILTQISKEIFPLECKRGLSWMLQSYVLKKKKPVTSGVQHLLYYWVERY